MKRPSGAGSGVGNFLGARMHELGDLDDLLVAARTSARTRANRDGRIFSSATRIVSS